jgi:hypothetical protein
MMRTVLIAAVALLASAELANAQVMARRITGRVMQTVGMPNWLIRNQLNQPQIVIVPTAPSPSGSQPGQPGASSSATAPATPVATVEIRIALPVAGATVSVNGVDFGKTDYYERKINVPESTDDNNHQYVVAAKWMKDGKEVNQTRTVAVGKRGKATANFLVEEQPAKQ